ncbi:MAG: class I SAM-dependent methyltransferase [Gammaproteobacteria bacterium]|nr:class I SAM-dependent methyltransferase [Gammaproteobacteria bacterium]NIR84484.1 class I SAM-dependent methyltransferase [Gammaproteobacteria bacterium]NIR90387.1 class I SAM-dependent methyltransferase [Gammaproteobacteria bacterium]NIU05535.1 class I SAM-dependent methyltransferase [Gammaproteobacteria bacterium]NIV52674.1 class I SAM-dependent methyltransferase [Gammaproteobacteria bacterium]
MNDVERRLELVHRFFSGTGSTYDSMVNAATFGIDRRWKRRIVDAIPADARRILDLACGTGILTFRIARRFPRAQVVGVELREEYLEIARRKGRRLGASNVQFFQGRAEEYLSPEPFDAVVSSYLAKYAELDLLTRNTRAMLADGGLVLMHDFTYPPKPLLVCIWRLYFRILQRFGTPLFPQWRDIFYGLPALIEETRWMEELTHALDAHGFREIRRRYLTLYGSAIVTARSVGRTVG